MKITQIPFFRIRSTSPRSRRHIVLFLAISWFAVAVRGEGECSASAPCTETAPCCSPSGFCGVTEQYCNKCNISASFTDNSAGKCPEPSTVDDPSDCYPDTNSCPRGNCCSRSNHCGSTDEFCGAGCKGGPCKSNLTLGAKIGIGIACVFAAFLVAVLIYFLRRRHKAKQDKSEGAITRFYYNTIVEATKHFSTRLGKGGFGEVFKGTLDDNSDIAVKRLSSVNPAGRDTPYDTLSKKSRVDEVRLKMLTLLGLSYKTKSSSEQPVESQLRSFESEIKALRNINHANLVTLRGYCFNERTGERFLVYEYVNNGTLADWLFVPRKQEDCIAWNKRKDIATNVASALEYLHSSLGKNECIIHLDIKPDNILLEGNLTAKVSDFGFAQLSRKERFEQDKPQAPGVVGTRMYRAPELESTPGACGSNPTDKADVFSYGIVLLELVCGRRVVHDSGEEGASSISYLPSLVVEAVKKANEEEIRLLDPGLRFDDIAKREAKRYLRVALWCLQQNPKNRPAMREVKMLLNTGYKNDKYRVDNDLPEGLSAELEQLGPSSSSNHRTSQAEPWLSPYGGAPDLESQGGQNSKKSDQTPLIPSKTQSSSDNYKFSSSYQPGAF